MPSALYRYPVLQGSSVVKLCVRAQSVCGLYFPLDGSIIHVNYTAVSLWPASIFPTGPGDGASVY